MTNLEASIKAIAMSFATALLSEIRKVPLTELQALATPAPAKAVKVAPVKVAPKAKAVKVAPKQTTYTAYVSESKPKATFKPKAAKVKAPAKVAPPAPKPVSKPAASTQATNGTVFIKNRVGGGFTATFGGKTYNATRSRDLAYKAKKAGFAVSLSLL
jgi:hypothetical protein